MRGLLLLGTDTGVGKTTIAVGLLRLARRRGLRLIPFKPAETGCDPVPHDAVRLQTAAGIPGLSLGDISPHQFTPPLAPAVAARLAGIALSPEHLRVAGESLASRGDGLLIEAAGGVLTPFAPDLPAVALADLFDIDVMLVSANRLGTISHTALALNELHRRAVRLAGFALVDTAAPATPDHATNAAEIMALTGLRPLGTLRHCSDANPDTIADAVAADLDLRLVLDNALS